MSKVALRRTSVKPEARNQKPETRNQLALVRIKVPEKDDLVLE